MSDCNVDRRVSRGCILSGVDLQAAHEEYVMYAFSPGVEKSGLFAASGRRVYRVQSGNVLASSDDVTSPVKPYR